MIKFKVNRIPNFHKVFYGSLRFYKVLYKHVNSGKLTPDTTMSDRLTSSRLATPTESRIIFAQFMSDPTQYNRRDSLSQLTVQHILIISRGWRFERYILCCFKDNH